MRFVPVRRVELQGSYHHGLSSTPARLTDNQPERAPDRPAPARWFLFESLVGRVSVDVFSTLRVYAGYGREKGTTRTRRRTGSRSGLRVDVLAPDSICGRDNRISHLTGAAGITTPVRLPRSSIGRSVYLTVEYDTSVSIVRFTDSGGVIVESQPKTRRYALTSVCPHLPAHLPAPDTEDLRDNTPTRTEASSA